MLIARQFYQYFATYQFSVEFQLKMKACLPYLCNIHILTSQFVSGVVGIGYLLFGINNLVIFILVSVRYLFGIFYSIFRIYIFEAFCCVHLVAFCGFLVASWQIFQLSLPYAATNFPALFCQFLGIFSLPLVSFLSFLQCFSRASFVFL